MINRYVVKFHQYNLQTDRLFEQREVVVDAQSHGDARQQVIEIYGVKILITGVHQH